MSRSRAIVVGAGIIGQRDRPSDKRPSILSLFKRTNEDVPEEFRSALHC